MKKKNILSLFLILAIKLFPQADTSITFNEVMFYTSSSTNSEFIELYNTSTTDTIDLNNFKIKYYTSSTDIIISAGFGTLLPPQSYAVIFEGDYDLTTGIYNGIVPASALILKLNNNAFGSSGMANTSSRDLILMNASGDTSDTYTYSANNSRDISDEKITTNKDNSSSNWTNTTQSNGTPGFRNTATPLSFNLGITSFTSSPSLNLVGKDINISATANNEGTQTSGNYAIEIFNDANFDSIAATTERIFTQSFTNLAAGDSTTVNTEITNPSAGAINLIAKVNYKQDEDTTNNSKIISLNVFPIQHLFNDIVINEIMYAPSSGKTEWVELYNKTDSLVNLNGWNFSDNNTTVNITNSDISIPTNSFIVLSGDSTVLSNYSVPVQLITFSNMPSLNNTGDAVVIKDSLGIIVDSLTYTTSWGGNNGNSLERIDVNDSSTKQSNWGTSININGATPGIKNSITPFENDLKLTSISHSPQLIISGDNVNLTSTVKNIGKNTASLFSFVYYNDLNSDNVGTSNEIISTQNFTNLAKNDSIAVNFTMNSPATGNFKIIGQINFTNDEDNSNNKEFDNFTVVEQNNYFNKLIVNEIMYAPLTGRTEWVEIYNRSDSTINLKSWKFSDNTTTVNITNNDITLASKSFIVLSSDSSLLNIYPNHIDLLVVSNLPSLNNSGDAVVLHDSLGLLIDSLAFTSDWGGSNGKSLERVEPGSNSNLQSNWGTSTRLNGATPGLINSLTQKDFNIGVTDIIYNPDKPLKGDSVSISAMINNSGKNNVQYSLELYDMTNADIWPGALVETKLNLTINSGEIKTESFNAEINNIQNDKLLIVRAVLNNDQDTTDNWIQKIISPGFPQSTIVLNEIMFTPVGGEPEWIEIYNTSTDSINLSGWSITDRFATPVAATISSDVFIQPKSFLVITRDSSILLYHQSIPSKITVLNFSGLNNDQDGVVLRDNRDLTIDSVLYNNNWGGTGGFSLEKKEFNVNSNLQTNWSSSTDNEMSTPGRINSIANRNFDLKADAISFDPRYPVLGDNVTPSVKVINKGQSNASNFSVQFFIDSNSDNIPDQLLSTVTGLNLSGLDSVNIKSSDEINNLQQKVYVGANIIFDQDEDTLNNYFDTTVEPGFAHNSIIINEIMYAPETGKTEWIELLNNSDESVNLKNWSVSDILPSPTKNFITNSDLILDENEYIILTKDSTFFTAYPNVSSTVMLVNFGSLGNTSDGVIIYDFRDAIIDSILYSSNWGGGNGFSLERISTSNNTNDSTNWTTSLSANHSTPGVSNSIVNIVAGTKGQLIINEIMYDPAEGNTEFIEFYNNTKEDVNIGGWKIFDEKGNNYKLSQTSLIIPSGKYFLLSADSTVISNYNLSSEDIVTVVNASSLGLTNTGELIHLKDFLGNTIDSVVYSDKWNNKNFTVTKNRSLERINPNIDGNDGENWSTSVSPQSATPGEQNSIFTDLKLTQSSISISPNPFSPDNDGFEDFTIISYNLSQAIAQVKIKIFDNQGRLVRTLENNAASGQKGSVIFNGLDDERNVLRMGIYIVYLEALNQNAGAVEALKAAMVVARKFN